MRGELPDESETTCRAQDDGRAGKSARGEQFLADMGRGDKVLTPRGGTTTSAFFLHHTRFQLV